MEKKVKNLIPERWLKALQNPWCALAIMASGIALVAAIVFELVGYPSANVSPLTFVSSLIAMQVSLFAAWPLLAKRREPLVEHIIKLVSGRSDSEINDLGESLELLNLNQKAKFPKALDLWDQKDPRLDLALFNANVPTMILDHEQRILDWNPAFDIIFGYCRGVRRGSHISTWFEHLDNFKRVNHRSDKLYGEGILPMADRERISYKSSDFGRMVFRKIMTPFLNQENGSIIGWTLVLNINSVNQRNKFFTALDHQITNDTRAIRYAASHDGVYKNSPSYKKLLMRHIQSIKDSYRVLEIGANTGMLTKGLLKHGKKVTVVENQAHLLRRIKLSTRSYPHMVRIIRQDPDQLRNVPSDRFDAAVLNQTLYKQHYPLDLLKQVYKSLKPGGTLTVSSILSSGSMAQAHSHLRRELKSLNCYENLKRQFQHVTEYEKETERKNHSGYMTREDLRALVLEAGFSIQSEETELFDGHTLMLVCRKISY